MINANMIGIFYKTCEFFLAYRTVLSQIHPWYIKYEFYILRYSRLSRSKLAIFFFVRICTFCMLFNIKPSLFHLWTYPYWNQCLYYFENYPCSSKSHQYCNSNSNCLSFKLTRISIQPSVYSKVIYCRVCKHSYQEANQ